MQMKLELVPVPVTDVDLAKAFYVEKVGFNADYDHSVRPGLRFVQLTPPGSACSIVIGTGLPEMEPGSLKGLQLVVTDIDSACAELGGRGVELGEVQELGRPGRPGFRFVFLSDPDGNGWAVQEIPSER
jgi:catechol 2,3-dioxygenase-like lactoylglutathione lyase family enzyme